MKKVLLMFVAGAFMSVSMISCSNCGHCSLAGVAVTSKVCKKDDQAAYDNAKAACVAPYTWVAN